jgi:metal-responsive CopG/Arc/MetJ family transcriptional regulator
MLLYGIYFYLIYMLEIAMKRTTVTLPRELIDELLEVTPAKNKTQAITTAIQERIKRKKMETLKHMAGQGRWQKGPKV